MPQSDSSESPLLASWHGHLVIVEGIALAYAIGCALLLRHAAERMRDEANRELRAAPLTRAPGRTP